MSNETDSRQAFTNSTSSLYDGDLVDNVYDQVVATINGRGLIGPDDISDGVLAQQLGVSRTPVRMALARLESEGLVRRVHGKGWVVITPTLKDIEDIFDVQETLEMLVVRKAAERIGPEASARLMLIADELKRAAEGGDLGEWFAVDQRFHDLLYTVVGNDRLTRYMGQLASQWYRFRAGYIAIEGQLAVLYQEHRAIAEAIVARDPDRAAECVLQHDRHIRQNLVTIVRNILAPFQGQRVLSSPVPDWKE
jgi:DNA-binding GntR family transcriptional regulator